MARDYGQGAAGGNPFLHLSMHLSISEQCSIDQPPGIRQAVELLAARRGEVLPDRGRPDEAAQLMGRWSTHLAPTVSMGVAQAAGLEIVDLRTAELRIEIHDVAAVVYLLRKVIWWVPGFTVEKHHGRLRDLHDRIQRDGPFIAHSTRHLIEARRPG